MASLLFALITAVLLLGDPLYAEEILGDADSYEDEIDYDDNGHIDIGDLSRAAQNPVADLITLPFQNNLNFLEEDQDVLNVLNIQPVLPIRLSQGWNLITRTIIPVIHLEDPPGDFDDWGLGDINQSFFFSPVKPSFGRIIWGFGPIVSYPSATEDIYGTDQWGIGPSFVGLAMTGPWVFGFLANQTWGFAGPDRGELNRFVIQPFANYNFGDGWFLQTSPFISANWKAESGEQWTVPVGGGIGRTFRIGPQPVTAIVSSFYNVERPTGGPQWTLRMQLNLLFPR